MFPLPALLADIGGTNARFAILPAPGAALSPVRRLATSAYGDLTDAARDALRFENWPRPRSMLIGAAGPIDGRNARLTNARWRLDGESLLGALGLDQGLLLNDFETLALSLPALRATDLMAIGPARAGTGNRLVIGPGTGLGVGALADVDGRHLPLASEGGHASVAATSAVELRVFAQLGFPAGRGRAEALLSGPGLPRLFAALATGTYGRMSIDAETVTNRALAGADEVAAAAVRLQLALLARFAGDMALSFLAKGGVYLAGGILPRIAGLIDAAAFRIAFEDNDAHNRLLAEIPVYLITAPEPAFAGLAALAAKPDAYFLNYAKRLWRSP